MEADLQHRSLPPLKQGRKPHDKPEGRLRVGVVRRTAGDPEPARGVTRSVPRVVGSAPLRWPFPMQASASLYGTRTYGDRRLAT